MEVKPSGEFEAGGLAALVRDLVGQLASGRLEVNGPGGTRYIWFEAGQIRDLLVKDADAYDLYT